MGTKRIKPIANAVGPNAENRAEPIPRCLLLVICGCIAITLVGTLHASMVMTYLSLLGLIVTLICLAFCKPLFCIKYSYVLFLIMGHLTGVFCVETQTFFLPELSIMSHFAGSLPLLTLYYEVLIAALVVFDRRPSVGIGVLQGKAANWAILAVMLFVAVEVIFILLALSNPFYATGADRFAYSQGGFVSSLMGKVSGYLYYGMPIACVVFQCGKRRIACVYVVLACIYGFLVGNKFGLFLMILYLALLGFYRLMQNASEKAVLKGLGIFAIAVVGILGISFLHNTLNYGYSIADNQSFLNERMAQEGQIWWRIYDLEKDNPGAHFSELPDEIDSWFCSENTPTAGTYGIYKLMYMACPFYTQIAEKISTGSRYTESTAADLFIYLGPVGMIAFAVAFAWFYQRIIRAYIESSSKALVIESILLLKLFTIANQVLTMSDFDVLFSWSTVALLLLYGLVKVVQRNKSELRQ